MGRHNVRNRLLRQLARAKASAGPLERVLREFEAEVQHSPKIETLERFVENIAFYFGNVFDAVASYGEILQMTMQRNSPLRECAHLMLRDAEAGKRLANNLLHEEGSVRLRLLALDHFIRELALLLSRVVEKKIELRTVLAGPVQNQRPHISCRV